MEIKLPIKAISSNVCWQGRRFATKAYKQYQKDCSWWLKGKKIEGEVEVKIKVFLKNYKRSDVDNVAKPLLDNICKAGLIDDDCKIKRLVLEKYPGKENSIEINIEKYV